MPYTLDSLNERLKEVGILPPMFVKKEMKFLTENLDDDEKLHHLVQGMYSSKIGILVATNKRVMFVDVGMFSSYYDDFPLKNISSISSESGLINTEIKIYASGNTGVISKVSKGEAREFVKTVKNLKEDNDGSTQRVTEPANNVSDDPYSKLEKLAKLKEQGILTEEEFNKEKQKVLSA